MGFRVIQVLNGEEPEQMIELTTLQAPTVSATSSSEDSITLSWKPVDGAVEYQIFEYFEETERMSMLNRTADTTITMENLELGSTHSYIVQPISCVEIADNVSPEYSVMATCGQEQDAKDALSLLSPSEATASEENGQESDSMVMPIVMGCIAAVGSVCLIVIALIKIKR